MSKDCGICGIYPRWLRDRATPKNFIAVYGLLGTVQAMAFIYIVVTLTTLEKRFKIPSRTTGKDLLTSSIQFFDFSLYGNYNFKLISILFISYTVTITPFVEKLQRLKKRELMIF